MRKMIFIIPAFIITLVISGCSSKPDVIHDLSNKNYTLVDSDGSVVNFPGDYRGKTVVIGFIYTHCPDICPMTTHNINLVKQELDKQGIKDVAYVDISFDPHRDTPAVLKEYANVRGINTDQFHFLTGNENIIKSLLKDCNIYALPGDTTIVGQDTSYFFIHTDRISVMGPDGKIRAEYKGSTANRKELIKDINRIR
jgi:protein SCO1/2